MARVFAALRNGEKMKQTDLEQAKSYFIKKLNELSDYFGEEKFPDEIKAIKIAIELIKKEIQYGNIDF
jgi:hypothetical protein